MKPSNEAASWMEVYFAGSQKGYEVVFFMKSKFPGHKVASLQENS